MERKEQEIVRGLDPEPTVLRIMDANLNRAREALRVMEEYARFALCDAGLSLAIKEARHDLQTIVQNSESATAELGQTQTDAILTHRDVAGDVGRTIGTESEYQRKDAEQVARAASKRLTEALRVLEEYGKTLDIALATSMEKLRYRAYDLERRITLTQQSIARFAKVHLYVLVTESLCQNDWYETAVAALRGGADCLQLREKKLSDRELLDRARRLANLCRENGALFIVNDRPDIARLSNANGVHLGQDDLTVADARCMLPAHCMVGISTHRIEQVKSAADDTPDYIAVGPMFETQTKPHNRIAGVETLVAARQHTALPLVAIGGIDDRNIESILSAAHPTICVSRAVIAQHDPAKAAANLRSKIVASRDR